MTTTLFHTLDRARWFLVPEAQTLTDGPLRVRRFGGPERDAEEGIAAWEVDADAAKAWLDARFSAGFARAGEAFGRLLSELRARRGQAVGSDLPPVKPTARDVLGASPGDLYTDPARTPEAIQRLVAWATGRLRPADEPPPSLDALGTALKVAAARVEARRAASRKLLRVGFFAELRHGDRNGVALTVARREAPEAYEADLVRYLRAAPVLIASPGPVRDALAADGGYIGTASIHTDGVWCWPGDLAHYVERYHVTLPAAFVAHGVRRGWAHVAFDASTVRM